MAQKAATCKEGKKRAKMPSTTRVTKIKCNTDSPGRFNPALEKLRDELYAAKLINDAQADELDDLRSCLTNGSENYKIVYSRAWRAEAALADCERELYELKKALSLATCTILVPMATRTASSSSA